jgi:hypothetical protein
LGNSPCFRVTLRARVVARIGVSRPASSSRAYFCRQSQFHSSWDRRRKPLLYRSASRKTIHAATDVGLAARYVLLHRSSVCMLRRRGHRTARYILTAAGVVVPFWIDLLCAWINTFCRCRWVFLCHWIISRPYSVCTRRASSCWYSAVCQAMAACCLRVPGRADKKRPQKKMPGGTKTPGGINI